jgi:hypothetical protein
VRAAPVHAAPARLRGSPNALEAGIAELANCVKIHGMTSDLRNCLECRASVSSDAVRCPNCGTTAPHGLSCCVCHERARAALSITLLNKSTNFEILQYAHKGEPYRWDNREYAYLHDECFRKALGLPLPQTIECERCRNNVTYTVSCERVPGQYYGPSSNLCISPCPTCANPNLLKPLGHHVGIHDCSDCSRCHLPIILGIHTAYLETETDSYDGSKTYRSFHATCHLERSKKPRVTLSYYSVVRPGIWREQKPPTSKGGFWSKII